MKWKRFNRCEVSPWFPWPLQEFFKPTILCFRNFVITMWDWLKYVCGTFVMWPYRRYFLHVLIISNANTMIFFTINLNDFFFGSLMQKSRNIFFTLLNVLFILKITICCYWTTTHMHLLSASVITNVLMSAQFTLFVDYHKISLQHFPFLILTS